MIYSLLMLNILHELFLRNNIVTVGKLLIGQNSLESGRHCELWQIADSGVEGECPHEPLIPVSLVPLM